MTPERIEQERRAFEAWYSRAYLPTAAHGRTFSKYQAGTYRLQHVHDAWQSWQARAAQTQVETHSESEIELTYPLFAKSRTNGTIILFTSQKTGICVFKGMSGNRHEEWFDSWVSAADIGHWQYLTFAEAEAEIFGEKK